MLFSMTCHLCKKTTRLAMKRPNAITAYIVQNGNIYEQGWRSSYWDPVRVWWTNPDPNFRTSLINSLQPPHIKAFVRASLRYLFRLLMQLVSGKVAQRRAR